VAKTAFVTGATGFVGLNLVEELLEQGWQVVAMHRAQSDVSALARLPGVVRVCGDITDSRSLKGLIPGRIDCVFHVAGNTSLWARSHAEQIKVNVKGTRNMVRAALEAGARRFVHTSSIVAFGLHGGVITEDTPTRGSTAAINYVRSKALAEREVHKGIASGLQAVLMNPSNILGPYDTVNWSRMFRLIQQGRLPAVPGGGGSFCHVREVARAHIAAAECGVVGQNYLLGGAQLSYLGLAREISEVMGLRRRFVTLHPRLLQGYARLEEWIAPLFGREPEITLEAVELLSQNIYCSSRKAQRELGYQPQPLQKMLDDTYRWLRASGQLKG
jgi:dihydroflavonol-4-reductase